MSEKRLKLQEYLESILGSKNVYFQPPSSLIMKYPAIVYSMGKISNNYADDAIYGQKYAYKVTIIDKNPDSEIVERVSKTINWVFDRPFTSDNLNHYVFTLYF